MRATIYKLVSPHTTLCYIGQTTKKYYKQRLHEHKCDYNRFYKIKKGNYRTSYLILNFPDVEIEVLEELIDADKKKIMERERYWIESTNSVNIANRRATRKKCVVLNK